MRIVLRILLALVLFLVVALFFLVRPVDRTNFVQTEYYHKTISARDAVQQKLTQPRRLLRAGVAKAGITPPVGVPLAGFGGRKGAASTGVHDSLFVRVLALQAGSQIAFVIGYDALLIYPDLARAIEQRLGVAPQQLYFTATHSHSGPGGWGSGFVEEQFAGKADSRVSAILIDSTIAAITRAQRLLLPAKWHSGKIDAPRHIRNRLLGDKGPIDDDLCYLAIQAQGKPLALLATYSAHATVMSAENLLISGDYPGYLERKVETKNGALTMMAAAGLGSHSNRGEGQGFEKAKNIGEALADSLLAHAFIEQGQDSVSLSCARWPVATPTMQVRLSKEYRLNSLVARRLFRFRDAYISFLRLNDFWLIGSPSEFSGELAMQVKAAAAEQGQRVTITSFNGCYLGYVVPSQYDNLEGYETRTMCWFGPGFGDYLAHLMAKAILQDM
jgi:neutral ceramidase